MTIEYRSKFEKTVAGSLKNEKALCFYYEPKDEKLDYTLKKKYIPDFVLTSLDGQRKIYIETKGWFKPVDRTKMEAVINDNLELDIRFVFMVDNPINKKAKRKTYYSDWCNKRGIQYAFKEIPEEWLDELRN